MTNLAIKGIIGVKAMAQISHAVGNDADGQQYDVRQRLPGPRALSSQGIFRATPPLSSGNGSRSRFHPTRSTCSGSTTTRRRGR